MAFQQVTLGEKQFEDKPVVYVKYKEVEPNTIIADGLYTGSYTGGQFNSTTHYVDCGANKVGLSSAGKLDKLIERANLIAGKSRVRITYLGKQPMASGDRAGQLAHDFALEVDNGN